MATVPLQNRPLPFPKKRSKRGSSAWPTSGTQPWRWTSKLGELEDIEHDLTDLEGAAYGKVVLLMKRATPKPK